MYIVVAVYVFIKISLYIGKYHIFNIYESVNIYIVFLCTVFVVLTYHKNVSV